MTNLYISEEALEKHNLSLGEFLVLMEHIEEINVIEVMQNLYDKDLIFNTPKYLANKGVKEKTLITLKGRKLLTDVILDSKKDAPEDTLEKLAESLKEIFPKGKKDGTLNYWTEGKALIIRRLKIFFKKYNKVYDNDTIIDAAKRYVASFNGNYSYMRTLKYFIFKDVKGAEEVENTSDLITWIENKDEENENTNDWTSEIR